MRNRLRSGFSSNNSKTYRYGSIYSGNKSVSTEWLNEKQATGVNGIRVINNTDAVINIGFGETAALASSAQKTVAVGDMRIIDVTGSYIGWQGTGTGTILLEQSVIR